MEIRLNVVITTPPEYPVNAEGLPDADGAEKELTQHVLRALTSEFYFPEEVKVKVVGRMGRMRLPARDVVRIDDLWSL
jgi:hypothetical protein